MLQKILKTGALRLWTYQRERLRQRHNLTYLFWECTLRCNFNCRHCGSNAKADKKYSGELSTEEIKRALKEIAEDFDPKKIMLAITGGEPLLRQDLFEVMDYASSLGFPWGLVSNGFLIDKKVAQKMKETKMSTISISTDGISKTHDDFRGIKGAYEKAIGAIKLLAEASFVKDLQITSTIHQGNISQLEQMYETFLSFGIISWRLFNVDPIGRAEKDKTSLLNGRQLRELLEFIKEKRKKSKVDITFGCAGFLGLDFEQEVRSNLFYCSTGINTASILCNGDIFVCPNVPRKKNLIQGNIRHDRFSKVWNNKFTVFRNKERTKCEKCSKCDFWEECLGNSFHLWDFEKNQPKLCHLEMSFFN